eukprot:4553713-Amphidinium_carterae.1
MSFAFELRVPSLHASGCIVVFVRFSFAMVSKGLTRLFLLVWPKAANGRKLKRPIKSRHVSSDGTESLQMAFMHSFKALKLKRDKLFIDMRPILESAYDRSCLRVEGVQLHCVKPERLTLSRYPDTALLFAREALQSFPGP